MDKSVLAIAEIREGKLRRVSLEALTAAKIAAGPEGAVDVLLMGSGAAAHIGELQQAGIRQILLADRSELEHYRPEAYAAVAGQAIDQLSPAAVIFGHTAIGRDLAPIVAAKYGCGQISDVIAMEWQDGTLRCKRPLYAGKAFETRTFREGLAVLTIRPNNFPAAEASGNGEVVEMSDTLPSLRTVVREVVRKASGKVDLTEAKIIVSGGRGVKSADGFKPLQQLADVLNGAVGASRGACDAGYCDYGLQIGQTGKVVTPELYIACGISGAIQHLAGMSQSRVIVAVNKDPEAPIFKVADYGIVGDLFEIVPLLTEAFQELLQGE